MLQLITLITILFLSPPPLPPPQDFADLLHEAPKNAEARTEPRHAFNHISPERFLSSVQNARAYEITDHIAAGVVPHHDTAAAMISGFFAQAARFEYDTVIILAPNHENNAAIVTSYRDWEIGVFAHREFAADLLAARVGAEIDHEYVERDHSAAILMPYIEHYLPHTKVAPVLLGRSLGFDGTLRFYDWLKNWVSESGESVLLVASVDFSHFLDVPNAAEHDRITWEAILARDYLKIHAMNSSFLDSAAAMIVWLNYLHDLGIEPRLIDRKSSADFVAGLEQVTTYKVIVGGALPLFSD
ncbi:MAG: AmmeMemoRadiSam system protein B [Defluviitaleaceae bacterium]|nr:AmmeMemoRadiSam system protein B [Defluviitaleaceae bacterium]